MVTLIKKLANAFGIKIRKKKSRGPNELVVSLQPQNYSRGNVLLSYIIEPFLLKKGESISDNHTHDWESFQIAQTFLNYGYSVDVISYLNKTFKPKKEYDFFIAARTNFDKIAKSINSNCKKVVHLDTAHWLFNNRNAYDRLLSLQKRKGITLANIKMVEPNWAIENADLATILGNQFTINTYAYSNKPIHRIPISNPLIYTKDKQKNFDLCRNNYLWFGSSGFVHKGLDLVLEAFTEMPEFRLTVCGPIDQEKDFVKAFHKELFQTANIQTLGWIDVRSPQFLEIANKCLGLIYPTCAEGGGGSAITCMHAGIIPVLSYEASVDLDDYGILLADCSIDAIKQAIQNLSREPAGELARMANRAWDFANENHTKESFAKRYEEFVSQVLLS